MKIAVIGWGSLLWDPGILEIVGEWRSDGPRLPIDFCRISGGRRLTIAILPGAPPTTAYWAISAHDDLAKAAKNLRQREKTFPEHIHFVSPEETHKACRPEVRQEVEAWLARKPELEAAVWTGLESNWQTRRGCPFRVADAIEYLRDLQRKGLEANARRYIVAAPAQSRTETWAELVGALDWKAAEEPPH